MDQNTYKFTVNSEINDLKRLDCIKRAAPYMFGNGEKIIFKQGYTFEDMQNDHPTWDAESAVYGANRMLEIARTGKELLYELENEDAKLLYFPAKEHKNNTYIILASGGGYFGVCTLVESMPAAAYLNELGFDVFCLNYRNAKLKLIPGVLEDVASAVRFIKTHADTFGVDPDKYVVGGFSAGGHLMGMWATEKYGYEHYNLPKPKAVWLNYPMVSADIKEKAGAVSEWIVRRLMFGLFSKKEKCREWTLNTQINENYPPVYLVMAKDDDTIPQARYEELKTALKENGVPHKVWHVEKGGHGYGLGRGTEAEGWIDRAVEFLKGQS